MVGLPPLRCQVESAAWSALHSFARSVPRTIYWCSTTEGRKKNMDPIKKGHGQHNVNMTLDNSIPTGSDPVFPCPVCGLALQIRYSSAHKPYCVCNACGIQLFIRGKQGIKRLEELLNSDALVSAKSVAGNSFVLYNRIQQLKGQRNSLKHKQGLIFQDPDLENAIRAVDLEIEDVQDELEKLTHDRREKRE
jgi:endogenous inhibitor of DNA gyrase (YacG/DUF329 family)